MQPFEEGKMSLAGQRTFVDSLLCLCRYIRMGRDDLGNSAKSQWGNQCGQLNDAWLITSGKSLLCTNCGGHSIATVKRLAERVCMGMTRQVCGRLIIKGRARGKPYFLFAALATRHSFLLVVRPIATYTHTFSTQNVRRRPIASDQFP